jgi:hypothetical protein
VFSSLHVTKFFVLCLFRQGVGLAYPFYTWKELAGMKSRAELTKCFLHFMVQNSLFCALRQGSPEEGVGISGLYLEGARWYKEQGRPYPEFSTFRVFRKKGLVYPVYTWISFLYITIFFFLFLETRLFWKSGLAYLVYIWRERTVMKNRAGWCRAYQVFSSLDITKFFVLCL